MQQLVMWLVVQGVGLADMAWDSYMKTPGIAANMSISKNTEDKARALAENIFMARSVWRRTNMPWSMQTAC